MAWTKWDEEQYQRKKNNPLAAALAYSYQQQEARRREQEAQAKKARAEALQAATAQPTAERTRSEATQHQLDLRRRTAEARQRTVRSSPAKLERARAAADQARARREQLAAAKQATGSTFSRVDDLSGREKLKPISGGAYVGKQFIRGAGEMIADTEDFSKANVANQLHRATGRIHGRPQQPTAKNLAVQLLTNEIGNRIEPVQDLLTTGWDKQLGTGDNLARIVTNAGDVALRVTALPGMETLKDTILQSIVEVDAARNGKTVQKAGRDLARRMMNTPNGFRELTGLDEYAAKLDAQAPMQRRGVRTAGEISRTVGAMTPAIALSAISGNGDAGLLLMAASAGGEKSRAAWEATGDVEKAWKAGLGTAMKEAATEKLFSFAGGVLGKGMLDKATRKLVGERGAARYLADALGEGAEEVLSQWLDSFVDRGTWDSEAQRATFRELLQAGALGTAVSLILGVPVMFRGGKMTVRDGEQLSEAQTREIDDAAAKARKRMQEIEDRAESLQAETAEWTRRGDREKADAVRAEIRKADEAYRQAMAEAGIDASTLLRRAAAQPAETAQTAAATAPTADAASLLRTAEEEAENRAAKLRDAGYKARGVYMDAQEDLEAAKAKLEEARKKGDAEKIAAEERKVAEAEARLAEAKTAWEAARDTATAPKTADQAAKVDATKILPTGESSQTGKRTGGKKRAMLDSKSIAAYMELHQAATDLRTALTSGDEAAATAARERMAAANEKRLAAEKNLAAFDASMSLAQAEGQTGSQPGQTGNSESEISALSEKIAEKDREVQKLRAELTNAKTLGDSRSADLLEQSLTEARAEMDGLRKQLAVLKEQGRVSSLEAAPSPGREAEPGSFEADLQAEYLRQGVTEESEEEDALPVSVNKDDPMTLPGVREMQAEVDAGEAAAGSDRIDDTVARSLTGKGVKKTRDLWRNLKNAAGKTDSWDQQTKTGQAKREKAKAKGDAWAESGKEQADANARELDEKIKKPYWKTKWEYQKATRDALGKLGEISKQYKIKKGTKASAAVQWYGEGVRRDSKGEEHPYGEQDLRREFGEARAKDIMAAADAIQRDIYEPYVRRVNRMLEKIYPDPEGELRAKMATAQAKIASYNEALKEATGDRKAQIENAIKKETRKYNSLAKSLQSGDYLQGKRLIPRKSYFHHFQETEKGLGAIDRLIEGSQAIDPLLVGTSEWTQPKTKYWGSLQHRLGGKYQADAIGGLQKYIPAAEYRIAWDPFITHMRGIIFGLAEDTQSTRNCNDLIQWLTDWTNDIAGKTNPWDRWLVQSNTGRKIIAVLRVASNRIRGNMVTLNLRSALAQGSNIGTAAGYITNPADWEKAAAFVAIRNGNSDIGAVNKLFRSSIPLIELSDPPPLEESPFLGERYLEKEISAFDSGIAGNAEKLAATMMRFLDKRATETIWAAAYNQGKRLGITEGDLVQYADEITMKSTAGRGVGEAPLAMKSEIIKLLQPFFLEANNAMQAALEFAKDGAFQRILLSMGANWLMNEILRRILGFDVTWDPIDAGLEAIETWRDSPEDDRTAWSLMTQVGRNELGELASNVFLGPLIAQQAFPEEADRKIVFGDRDPLQYGNQNVAVKTVTAPLTRMLAGKDFSDELLDATLMLGLPVGGRAVERAISETKRRTGFDPVLQIKNGEKLFDIPARAPGTSYDKRGNVRYPLEEGTWPTVRGAAFGEWTTPAGKAYLKGGSKSLNEANSRDYERLVEAGLSPQQAWDVIQGILDSKARKDRDGMIYFTKEKWWPGFQRMDSVQKEIAAEMALRAISDERLEKAQAAKTECWVSLADALEYGETGNAKEALAWLEQSGLSASQKEYLYNNPISGQERSGSYRQWEEAKRELEGNRRYQRLSPEDKDALLKKCLDYKPGDAAKADAAVVAGWKLSEYYLWSEYASRLHADKDENGKTISGSAKDKKIYMMEHSGLSKGKQALFLLLSEGYKLDAEMMAAANEELAKQNLSYAELKEIAEACGCKLANGKLVR